MLRLRQAEYEDIRRHGEETYPDECCGILIGTADGDGRKVMAVERCGNARTDAAQNSYEIDPKELIRVQRNARERDLEIVGFYHSHPDHPARWSKTDLEEAHWIGYSYVITSIERGIARQMTSFLLTGTREEDKSFAEEELTVA